MDRLKALEFEGIKGWINSNELKLSDLIGKVVFLDFWTYTCINCRRTLPHLKRFYNKYKKYGFVLIGIHTPGFSFERERNWVEKAVKKLGIEYPVALDSDNITWFKYGNSYWPRQFIIDHEGYIVYEHIGEGDYEEIEEEIIRNLKKINPSINEEAEKVEPEWFLQIGWHRITPEIYLGYYRMNAYQHQIFPYENFNYKEIEETKMHRVHLIGKWMVYDECLTYLGGEAKLKLRFYAKNVYVVLNSLNNFPCKLKIYLDGKTPNEDFLSDAKIVNGEAILNIDMPDMYHLLKLKKPEEHVIELIPISKGLSFYTFTFG